MHRFLSALLLATAGVAQAQVIPAETASVTRASALPTLAATNPNLIADLAAAVSPAVVNIRVTSDTGEVVSEGHGSGFVISPSGEVVTNHHVIDEGTTIEIEFNNGVSFEADIIGSDPETDIALLQIRSDQTFPTVRWHGSEPVRIGEFVVPIGNPFGIGQSVSFGIISAIGRDRVDSGAYVDYIQTDATVNTGNSGGPLFDLEGKVVAINSAIYSPTGASVGIAFAIPHYHAESVIETLRRDGKVSRGYLGVGFRTAEYSSGRVGAIVDSVVPGGPAQAAGLQRDDIVYAVNGTPVANGKEAARVIGGLAPGETALFAVERDNAEQKVTARLTERPSKAELQARASGLPAPTLTDRQPVNPRAGATASTGLSVIDLSSQFRSAIGMSYDQVGVYVETVLPGSNGEAATLALGDVLMEFDTQPISDAQTFERLVLDAQDSGKSDALVKIRRKNGTETYVTLRLV